MPPLDLSTAKLIGSFRDATIYIVSAPEFRAWLLISSDSDPGTNLARSLYPNLNALIDRVQFNGEVYWCIPYLVTVDGVIMQLIDLLAEMRRSAGAIQLTMTGFDA